MKCQFLTRQYYLGYVPEMDVTSWQLFIQNIFVCWKHIRNGATFSIGCKWDRTPQMSVLFMACTPHESGVLIHALHRDPSQPALEAS